MLNMIRTFVICLLFLIFLGCEKEEKDVRLVQNFNYGWLFKKGENPKAFKRDLDTLDWRNLNLPHDWSIEGEFSEEYPTRPEEGALPAGIGWYRKTFKLPKQLEGKLVSIEFDGIFRNSEVWINEHYLGKRPNGYISFSYELTEHLKFGGAENVIAVKVDNSAQPNSRWYTGSGIYRNVRLVSSGKLKVDHWGTFVTTPEVNKDSATVNLQVKIKNSLNSEKIFRLVSSILDTNQVEVANVETLQTINPDTTITVGQDFKITNPELWDVENPYMYKVVTKVYDAKELTDNYETPLGIRYFEFDPETGFSLNGEPLKILGVNRHHDLGALGAAVNIHAIKRQLRLFKEMGVNAIRTSHNPPSPELLKLTDEMGFIVQDESFDMWKKKKNAEDYHKDWDEWHKQDLEDLIKRDRNHPSVMMWSIGNEIREQFDSTGIEITRELVDIVKSLDTTRPVTSALSENIPKKNYIYQSGALDVLGFNYKHEDYKNFPAWYPNEKIIITESASAIATRGQYDMPSDSVTYWPPAHNEDFDGNDDFTVSAYDNVAAYWGATHEAAWKEVKKFDFIAGVFVWAGMDYLGEPLPYPYPARSSYLGIIDLAGFPKDSYYMYKSEWSEEPVLHIFPHWNWAEGQVIDVWAYYNNADEVELFLNGESLGIKHKENDKIHLAWKVNYTPGTLKAVSRKNGKVVLEEEINTAGEASKIELNANKSKLKSDGEDLSFITVSILDKKGDLVPKANNLVEFEISGGGKIVGVDNGYQASLESFKANKRKAFNGKCLVIVQSNGEGKAINLKAISKGIEMKTIKIEIY